MGVVRHQEKLAAEAAAKKELELTSAADLNAGHRSPEYHLASARGRYCLASVRRLTRLDGPRGFKRQMLRDRTGEALRLIDQKRRVSRRMCPR